jgi:hypothetical protein
LEKARVELQKHKEIQERLEEFLNDVCFQETEFERVFLESVVNIKQKRFMAG